MQGLIDAPKEEYTSEASQEEKQKIANAGNAHVLIPEEKVQDLQYVELSRHGYHAVKRAFDIILAAIGLMILLIPIALLALVVYIDDPGAVFFAQDRVGRYGKRFRLYKFRTMKTDTPKYLSTMELEDPEKYITRVGRILRKTSLDEIPQLLNVLKGDMSLIGPRPLISNEYEIHQMRMRFGVYNIRPGVTGLAQINGRDTVTPVQKVRWDVKYLEEYGLAADVKILLSTILKVFSGEDVVEGYGSKQEIEE